MKEEERISKCCQAYVDVSGGDEGTMHWECTNCHNACDAFTPSPVLEEKNWYCAGCNYCVGGIATTGEECVKIGHCDCHFIPTPEEAGKGEKCRLGHSKPDNCIQDFCETCGNPFIAAEKICHCGDNQFNPQGECIACKIMECEDCSLPQHKEEDHTRPCDMKEFGFCSDFGKYCPNYKDSWEEEWENSLMWQRHPDVIKKWIKSRMESIRKEGIEEEREQFLEMIYRMEAMKWNDISKERDNFNEGWSAACRNARSPQYMQPKELKK